MATAYKNLAQAQAAYDTIRQQKERLQRNDYIREQQAVMGVNNYLRQNGYNGGAAESILLRARGNRSDFGSYDAQLADLAAIISGFRARGRGGIAPTSEPTPRIRYDMSMSTSAREAKKVATGVSPTYVKLK